jgi:hypothetical protein
MKNKTLALAVGLGAPLILTGSSDAGFVGLKVFGKPNPFGLFVSNVYAEFDNPGHDWMQACAGIPVTPVVIRAWADWTGDPPTSTPTTFYNHQFGSDLAPGAALIEAFPSLAFDSFYTIGMKAVPPGGENHTTLVHMPPLEGSAIVWDSCAWTVLPPTDAQGNPFDPIHSFPGNGQVLIGQFTIPIPGTPNLTYGVEGTFYFQCISDGEVLSSVESFEHFSSAPPCPWDCQDVPDGEVNIPDFLALLDQWHTSGSCDFDGGDVHVTDFLALLAHWGPCPQ